MAKSEKSKDTTSMEVLFPEEKMEALEQFLDEKGSSLALEIASFVEKLYEKTVPLPVKKFLEAKEKRTEKPASTE